MQPKMNSQCYEAEAGLDFQVLVLHHESSTLSFIITITILEMRVELLLLILLLLLLY